MSQNSTLMKLLSLPGYLPVRVQLEPLLKKASLAIPSRVIPVRRLEVFFEKHCHEPRERNSSIQCEMLSLSQHIRRKG